MREITNTIVLDCFKHKQAVMTNVINWRNNLLARSVAWLLRVPQVRAVVEAEVNSVFLQEMDSAQTPIAKAVDEAIDEALAHFDVDMDAGDVKGLEQEIERCIDHAMENIELDAKDLRNFDRVVSEVVEVAIEETVSVEKITEDVIKAVVERLSGR